MEQFEKTKIDLAYNVSHLEHVISSKNQQIQELGEAFQSAKLQIESNVNSLLQEELRICELEKQFLHLSKKFESQTQELEDEKQSSQLKLEKISKSVENLMREIKQLDVDIEGKFF